MEPIKHSTQNNINPNRNGQLANKDELGKLDFPQSCTSVRTQSLQKLNSIQMKLATILVTAASSLIGAQSLYAKDKERGCGKDQSCTREREFRDSVRENRSHEREFSDREHQASERAREAREAAARAEAAAKAQADAAAKAAAEAQARADAAAKAEAAAKAAAEAKAVSDAKAQVELEKMLAEAIKAEQAKKTENSCKAPAPSGTPELFEQNSKAIQRETQKVEVCSREAETTGNIIGLQHDWIKTFKNEAGMGEQGGGVPGQQNTGGCGPFGTPVSVNDHTGQSTAPGAECETVPDVDPNCVDNELEIGRDLGGWQLDNNCQTFVDEVIERCEKKLNQNNDLQIDLNEELLELLDESGTILDIEDMLEIQSILGIEVVPSNYED